MLSLVSKKERKFQKAIVATSVVLHLEKNKQKVCFLLLLENNDSNRLLIMCFYVLFIIIPIKAGKAVAPALVPAPAPAKKALALAPSSYEAPTYVLEVPAPAPSRGPSVSNYFRMKPLVYSVASEA